MRVHQKVREGVEGELENDAVGVQLLASIEVQSCLAHAKDQ